MSGFKEAVRSGLEEYLEGLKRAIDGLTLAEVYWQPTLQTNPIAWQVWHMARVEDRWVGRYLCNSTEVWTADGWADRFGMDHESVGFGQTMEEVRAMPLISTSDLMDYFGAVRAVTLRWLDEVAEEDLSKEYEHQRLVKITGAWIVGHILVEESQHTGQIAMIRGMIRGFCA